MVSTCLSRKINYRKTFFDRLGDKHNLSSNSLSDLLKAPLLVELEAPASALSWCDKHTLVEVGRGLQLLPRLLLQLLSELLSFYRPDVCCRDRHNSTMRRQWQNIRLLRVYEYWTSAEIPFSVGMRCVSSTSLPLASTVLPLSSRIRGVGLFTSLISTFL